MTTFNDLDSLLEYVEEVAEDVLRDEVAKEGVEIMRQMLWTHLYSRPESPYYERTYELYNSIIGTFQDSMSIKKRKILDIHNSTDTNFMPSKHPNWLGHGRRNMNKWIPQFIDEGHGGIIDFEGIGYIEKTQKELEDKIDVPLIKGFANRGVSAYMV